MHYTREQLESYHDGEFSQSEAVEIEKHLADCAACATVARFSYDLARLRTTTSAGAHGEAYWRNRIERGLGETLHAKVRGLAATILGAVHIRRTWDARIKAKGLSSLLAPGALYPELAGGAMLAHGSAGEGDSVLLGQSGGAMASVMAEPDALRVEWQGLASDHPAPTIVIVPAEPGEPAVACAPHWDDATKRWIVDVDHPPDDYLVAIVPGDSPSQ
jgi:hypothetical protein